VFLSGVMVWRVFMAAFVSGKGVKNCVREYGMVVIFL